MVLMCFNSTLVRLKVLSPELLLIVRNLFQFHFGTIKRGGVLKGGVRVIEFQFHFGTIKRLLHLFEQMRS